MWLELAVFIVALCALAVIWWNVARAALPRHGQFRFGILDMLLATLVVAVAMLLVRAGNPWLDAIGLMVVASLLAPLLWLPKLVWDELKHARRKTGMDGSTTIPGPPSPGAATGRRRRPRLQRRSTAIQFPRLSPYALIDRPLTMDDS